MSEKMWPSPDSGAFNVGADPEKHWARIQAAKDAGKHPHSGRVLGIMVQMEDSESCPCSQAQEEDSLDQCSLDSGQLPLLRTTPIARESSVRGAATWPTPQASVDAKTNPHLRKKKDRQTRNETMGSYRGDLADWVAEGPGARGFPSTPTCAPSTPSPARATSSPAASPASRTVRPGSASAAWTPETSGLTPFAYCERVTLPSGSSRTYPVSSQAEMPMDGACSVASLATFPKRGSMRNGACWERTMSAPRIDASGCGSWPSATATTRECTPQQWKERREDQGGTLRSTYLQDAVKYQVEERSWPTPQTSEIAAKMTMENVGARVDQTGYHANLEESVAIREGYSARGGATPQTWGTPTSRDHKDTGTMENVPENALLGRQVLNRWKSPTASEAQHGVGSRGRRASLNSQINENSTPGSLNPTWVEWLMGWPREWTDCEASVTPSVLTRWRLRSRCWLRLLGYDIAP